MRKPWEDSGILPFLTFRPSVRPTSARSSVLSSEKWKNQSVSQTIDLVETIRNLAESSKSELSSRGKRPFKVLTNNALGWLGPRCPPGGRPVNRYPRSTYLKLEFFANCLRNVWICFVVFGGFLFEVWLKWKFRSWQLILSKNCQNRSYPRGVNVRVMYM